MSSVHKVRDNNQDLSNLKDNNRDHRVRDSNRDLSKARDNRTDHRARDRISHSRTKDKDSSNDQIIRTGRIRTGHSRTGQNLTITNQRLKDEIASCPGCLRHPVFM